MRIVLYTYQTREAYQKLQKDGVLYLRKEDRPFTKVGKDDNKYLNHFERPYDFIIHSMKNKLPLPNNKDAYYPIWGWYKYEGRYKPSKFLDDIHKGLVRLKIEIASSRVLLSDFDYFSYLISGGNLYINLSKDDEKKYEDKIFEEDEFYYPNYEYMFLIHRKKDDDYGFSYHKETIQGTFWELYLEDVKEVVEV